jgi:cysteine dioxygenase
MVALSTSPTSTVLAYDTGSDIFYSNNKENQVRKDELISLKEFTEALPPLLRRLKSMERNSLQGRMQVEQTRGTRDDPVTQLFSRLNLNESALKEYALSEPSKNYTRNLVSTDNETYTLLLLCWNPGKQSPIHDHPCDGCWVRVCQGKVKETRYEMNKDDNSLCVTSVETYQDNKAVSYINDYMGYHKVENPSDDTPAITLHLYCPPFEKCKIWLDPSDASRTSKVCMCNYSEYGDSHACDYFAVNMI